MYSRKLYEVFCYVYVIFYTSKADDEYYLFEITTYSERERRSLYMYHVSDSKSYFLNGVTNEAALPVIVLVKPQYKKTIINFLRSNDIQFSYDMVTTNNLSEEYDSSSGEDIGNFSQEFHDFNEVQAWVNETLSIYPKEIKKIKLGRSFENRELFVLKIAKEPRNFAVFILGGEEARDWAPPALIINMVEGILQRQSVLRPLLQFYDFYFMPFINPDGYEYSRKKDRFWLMNRRVIQGPRQCKHGGGVGVAIDRNWFFKSKPHEDYCAGVNIGQDPLSEQEAKSLSQYLDKIAPKLLAFIDLRGFGRYITIPYGFTEMPVNNHKILMQIVDSGVKNKNYFFETSNFLLYNFTGNCPDWVKHELNVPFVCTIYANPPNSIIPKESDIGPLTNDVSDIIAAMLNISKDIYGPLFNSKLKHSSSCLLWMCCWGVFIAQSTIVEIL